MLLLLKAREALPLTLEDLGFHVLMKIFLKIPFVQIEQ